MEMDLNGDIIRQLYNEITSENRKDNLVEKASNGFVLHNISTKPSCLKAFYRFFAAVKEAFPDYKLLLDNIMVKGNRVMAHYTISGIHQGEFMGMAATNEPMAVTGIDIFCLDKGQIIEYWDAAHQISASSKRGQSLPSPRPPGNLIVVPSDRKQLSLSA
jgi:predicted SnoaL-like aldol condensation-catalyzing enzyme